MTSLKIVFAFNSCFEKKNIKAIQPDSNPAKTNKFRLKIEFTTFTQM